MKELHAIQPIQSIYVTIEDLTEVFRSYFKDTLGVDLIIDKDFWFEPDDRRQLLYLYFDDSLDATKRRILDDAYDLTDTYKLVRIVLSKIFNDPNEQTTVYTYRDDISLYSIELTQELYEAHKKHL